MPKVDGIKLYQEIRKIDKTVRVCFITAGEANIEVLRELYPTRS